MLEGCWKQQVGVKRCASYYLSKAVLERPRGIELQSNRLNEALQVVNRPWYASVYPALQRLVRVYPDQHQRPYLIEDVNFDLLTYSGELDVTRDQISLGIIASRVIIDELAQDQWPYLPKDINPETCKLIVEDYFWQNLKPVKLTDTESLRADFLGYLKRIKPRRRKAFGPDQQIAASTKGKVAAGIRKWHLAGFMQQLDQSDDFAVGCVLHCLGYFKPELVVTQFCAKEGISPITYDRTVRKTVINFSHALVKSPEAVRIDDLVGRASSYQPVHNGQKLLAADSPRQQLSDRLEACLPQQKARLTKMMTKWERQVFAELMGETGGRLATAAEIAAKYGKRKSQVHAAWKALLTLVDNTKSRSVDTKGNPLTGRAFPLPIIRLLEEYGPEYFVSVSAKYQEVFECLKQGWEAGWYPNYQEIREKFPYVDADFVRNMQVYFRRMVAKG